MRLLVVALLEAVLILRLFHAGPLERQAQNLVFLARRIRWHGAAFRRMLALHA